MKKIILFFTLNLVPFFFFGQDEYSSRLSIIGGISELGISPSEEIWAATKAGNVYYTKNINELWHNGPFGSLDPYDFRAGETFERINFFSEDTLMISGYIQENGNQDFVYWSGDHGKNWEKIKFGKSSWIDAAYINNNGKAWMSGNSQLIYFTNDSGKTWTAFDKIESKGNLRFSTIHFAKNEQTGLFGSFWNVLYRTKDNCQHWEKLPTPLSQNKYKTLSKKDRPEIKKIRILGNKYIINQQGKVFVTNSDTIDWTYLPNVIDFEVTENENIYFLNQDLSIDLYDKTFLEQWKSEETLENYPRAFTVKNNKLFILTDYNIYKVSPDEFTVSQLFTNDVPISEAYLKLSFEGDDYGFEDRDILRYNKTKKLWYRYLTVDFEIGNATIFENQIILSDRCLTKNYVLNTKEKSVRDFLLPNKLFSDNQIKEIHFENGSEGCFHSNNSSKIYIQKGGKLVLDQKLSSIDYLPLAPKEIELKNVQELVKILDNSRTTKISLEDFRISETDIEEFKKFIDVVELQIKSSDNELDFKNLFTFPGENTDFDFYRATADSLNKLSEEELNRVFWLSSGIWSTTTIWRSITIVYENDKKITIGNSDFRPKYFYAPWIVEYEGLKFRTNSILLGQQVDELTNGQFIKNEIKDKKYAIFLIADYLYNEKLDSE